MFNSLCRSVREAQMTFTVLTICFGQEVPSTSMCSLMVFHWALETLIHLMDLTPTVGNRRLVSLGGNNTSLITLNRLTVVL